ncbi:MAG: cell division protein ZapA [Robiginitomaculum sp.]|nr:cell division protein ZapA [Robiginitomaculum sp.]
MSKVSIKVNNRAFSIGCEPGQEAHVQALGDSFAQKVDELADQVGQIGDLRLFLMAALVITDELEATKQGSTADQDQDKIKKIEQTASNALNQAAIRIEKISDSLK